MKTINVGSMFGANETKIHILDQSEQSRFHGFLLTSGDCITCKPLPQHKMEEYCLQNVQAHPDSPIYLDIVIDYDDPQMRGLPGGLSIIATGKNRVKQIRLTTDINCM